MSDRLVVMNAGRIEQLGAPREVYERPRTRFVAGLHRHVQPDHRHGALARRHDRGPRDRAPTSRWSSPTPATAGAVVGKPLDLTVRPEKIVLRRRAPASRAGARSAGGSARSSTSARRPSTPCAPPTAATCSCSCRTPRTPATSPSAAQDVWLSWRPEHSLALARRTEPARRDGRADAAGWTDVRDSRPTTCAAARPRCAASPARGCPGAARCSSAACPRSALALSAAAASPARRTARSALNAARKQIDEVLGRAAKKTGQLDFANWPLYIDVSDKNKSDHPSHRHVHQADRHQGQVQRGHPAGRHVLRQDPAGAGGRAGHRLRPDGHHQRALPRQAHRARLPGRRSTRRAMANFYANASALALDPSFDRGNVYTMPWQSGITGIGYDPKKLGRKITSWQDLQDPALQRQDRHVRRHRGHARLRTAAPSASTPRPPPRPTGTRRRRG